MNIRKTIRQWLGIPEPLTVEFMHQVRELKQQIIAFMEAQDAGDKAYREAVDQMEKDRAPAIAFLQAVSRHESGAFILDGSLGLTGTISVRGLSEARADNDARAFLDCISRDNNGNFIFKGNFAATGKLAAHHKSEQP